MFLITKLFQWIILFKMTCSLLWITESFFDGQERKDFCKGLFMKIYIFFSFSRKLSSPKGKLQLQSRQPYFDNTAIILQGAFAGHKSSLLSRMVDWYLQLTESLPSQSLVRDRLFIRGLGGGLVQMGWGSCLFVHLKTGGCIKFATHFWGAIYFCTFQFLFQKKETTLKESTTSQLQYYLQLSKWWLRSQW